MTPNEIRELLNRPTITPAQLIDTGIYPTGKNATYAAIKRGEIDAIRIGSKIAIITAPLRRKLGLEP
ncbi:DNA-binding protein [Bradyrhizobium sp. URHC0002]